MVQVWGSSYLAIMLPIHSREYKFDLDFWVDALLNRPADGIHWGIRIGPKQSLFIDVKFTGRAEIQFVHRPYCIGLYDFVGNYSLGCSAYSLLHRTVHYSYTASWAVLVVYIYH